MARLITCKICGKQEMRNGRAELCWEHTHTNTRENSCMYAAQNRAAGIKKEKIKFTGGERMKWSIPCKGCSKVLQHEAEIGTNVREIVAMYEWKVMEGRAGYLCPSCKLKDEWRNK